MNGFESRDAIRRLSSELIDAQDERDSLMSDLIDAEHARMELEDELVRLYGMLWPFSRPKALEQCPMLRELVGR